LLFNDGFYLSSLYRGIDWLILPKGFISLLQRGEPVCDLFWNKKSFSRKRINHDVHHRIKLLGFRILEPQISWVLSFFENELVRYKNWKVKEKLMRAILFNFEWGDINVVNFGRFLTKAFFWWKTGREHFSAHSIAALPQSSFFRYGCKIVFLSRNFWWKFFFQNWRVFGTK